MPIPTQPNTLHLGQPSRPTLIRCPKCNEALAIKGKVAGLSPINRCFPGSKLESITCNCGHTVEMSVTRGS